MSETRHDTEVPCRPDFSSNRLGRPTRSVVRPSGRADRARRFDLCVRGKQQIYGDALLAIEVVLLLLPFVQEQRWQGNEKWLLLPVAAAALAAFLGWERRRSAPVIDLGLFRKRTNALGTLLALLYFAGPAAIFFIFTLYLQNGQRYRVLMAGVAITPFALRRSDRCSSQP